MNISDERKRVKCNRNKSSRCLYRVINNTHTYLGVEAKCVSPWFYTQGICSKRKHALCKAKDKKKCTELVSGSVAQWVKALTTKPVNLSLISGIVEEVNFYTLSSDLHMCTLACVSHAHTQMLDIKFSKHLTKEWSWQCHVDSDKISNFKITCVYYTSTVKENIL